MRRTFSAWASVGVILIVMGFVLYSAPRVECCESVVTIADAGAPAAKQKEEEKTFWGAELEGLQGGVEFAGQRKPVYRAGEKVSFRVKVQNVSKEAITISYVSSIFGSNPPIVRDARGERVRVYMGPQVRCYAHVSERTIKAGETVELGREEKALGPDGTLVGINEPSLAIEAAGAGDGQAGEPTIRVGAGKYTVVYSGFVQSVPKLVTGKVEVEEK